jgi:hypothetical protein
MVEYFWRMVFEGIREYWVNTKFFNIPISFENKNTKEDLKGAESLEPPATHARHSLAQALFGHILSSVIVAAV